MGFVYVLENLKILIVGKAVLYESIKSSVELFVDNSSYRTIIWHSDDDDHDDYDDDDDDNEDGV